MSLEGWRGGRTWWWRWWWLDHLHGIINLHHQTGPEAWNRGISCLISLIIGCPRAMIHDSCAWVFSDRRSETRIWLSVQTWSGARRGNWRGEEGGQWQWAISGQFPSPPPRNTRLQTPPPPGIQRSPACRAAKCQKCKKYVKILSQQSGAVTYKSGNRMKIFARHGWHQNARSGWKHTK